MLAELLNDKTVCDVLMSINSVSDQGGCLTHHYGSVHIEVTLYPRYRVHLFRLLKLPLASDVVLTLFIIENASTCKRCFSKDPGNFEAPCIWETHCKPLPEVFAPATIPLF
jgi:hypothetical protein